MKIVDSTKALCYFLIILQLKILLISSSIFNATETQPKLKQDDTELSGLSEINMIIVTNEVDYKDTSNFTSTYLVQANTNTRVILVGNKHLTNDDRITFSVNKNAAGSVCSPSVISFEIHVLKKEGDITIAEAFINLPPIYLDSFFWPNRVDNYFICIQSNSSLSASFYYPSLLMQETKIQVYQELLPVWLKICFVFIGFIGSFYASGMALGIMTIDITDLLTLRKSGTKKQQNYAENLLPIRKNGNRILCTLLLSNVAFNSLVTVFLNNLIDSGWVTFVVSTLSLCIIGEVVPQAVFNRHGFLLASKTLIAIKFLLIITAPFAVPIGLILDKILGAEAGMAYTRKEMRQLIELQYERGNLKIHETEMHILQSALALQKTNVESLMIELGKVFMISIDSQLDFAKISTITNSGYTRIPVYSEERFFIKCLLK